MTSNILEYFPYPTPRPVQEETLTALEQQWDKYDCFVIVAPTATGKTPLSLAIAEWAGNARILTPNNLLVQQYTDEFKHIPSLVGKQRYRTGNQYAAARYQFDRASVGVTNYHLYSLQMLQDPQRNSRSTLIIDEAHNTLPFLQDQHKLTLWKHKNGFPWWSKDSDEIRIWLQRLPKRTKIQDILLRDLLSEAPRYVLDHDSEWGEWSGGGKVPWDRYYGCEATRESKMTRGEVELLPQLVAKPIDIRDYPETLWPRGLVSKVILMSATINQRDIRSLGLDRRRVCYLHCDSPIPAASRPVQYAPVVKMHRWNKEDGNVRMADAIFRLSQKHAHEKGLIHATYEQAEELARSIRTMDDPTRPGRPLSERFIFHTPTSKAKAYQQFREASPESGTILVGSGMYEGLDLPDDLGRWQALAKIPWQSLEDPAIKHMAEVDPSWYTWETFKLLIQACGRICRTPTDYGITYILDGSFEKLYTDGKKFGLIPDWWAEAVDLGRYTEEDVDKFLEENAELMDRLSE